MIYPCKFQQYIMYVSICLELILGRAAANIVTRLVKLFSLNLILQQDFVPQFHFWPKNSLLIVNQSMDPTNCPQYLIY